MTPEQGEAYSRLKPRYTRQIHAGPPPPDRWREKFKGINTLVTKQGHRCWYCGDILQIDWATIDHVVPRSKGGKRFAPDNLVAACYRCNQQKADLDLEEFRKVVEPSRPHLFYGEWLKFHKTQKNKRKAEKVAKLHEERATV